MACPSSAAECSALRPLAVLICFSRGCFSSATQVDAQPCLAATCTAVSPESRAILAKGVSARASSGLKVDSRKSQCSSSRWQKVVKPLLAPQLKRHAASHTTFLRGSTASEVGLYASNGLPDPCLRSWTRLSKRKKTRSDAPLAVAWARQGCLCASDPPLFARAVFSGT